MSEMKFQRSYYTIFNNPFHLILKYYRVWNIHLQYLYASLLHSFFKSFRTNKLKTSTRFFIYNLSNFLFIILIIESIIKIIDNNAKNNSHISANINNKVT